jgi:hypothetical protein
MNTERTENTEVKEITNLERVELMVAEYIAANGASPFTDIQMNDNGTIDVDMDERFEKALQETFKDDLNESLGEYFTKIIKELIEAVENGEITAEDFAEETETTETTETKED